VPRKRFDAKGAETGLSSIFFSSDGFGARDPARIAEEAAKLEATKRILDFSTRKAIVGVLGYGINRAGL